MKKIILIAIGVQILGSIAMSQEKSAFDSLVGVLERKFDVRLYYNNNQTKGLDVIPSAGSLTEILKKTLDGTGLNFYTDNKKRVFIFRGSPLQIPLPDSYFNADFQSNAKNLNAPLNEAVQDERQEENKIFIIGKKGGTGNTALISGYIRDARNGEPVSSASVIIEGTQAGVSSDAYGFFSITAQKGRQILKVTSVGMNPATLQLNIQGNGKLDLELNEQIRSLKTAVIVGNKQSNVRGMQMGVERLSIRSIKQIPAVLGETDILRSLQTLPGVTSVGEGTAGYNVRGGGADQNLLLLNDMTIYNPTHLFGFFSAVDPEVVRGLELYKSAIPERLGGRISSIMDVSTKDGNSKKVTATAGIGPLTSKFTVEGPAGSEKTTFLVGGRTTYSNWFLKYLPDATFSKSIVNFSDLMMHITHEISENDKLYVSAYLSSDKFRLNQDSTYSYANKNFRVKWKHNFSNKFYQVFSIGTDQYNYSVKGRNNPKDAFDLNFGLQQWSAKSDFKYAPDNKQEINFGVQHILYNLQPGKRLPTDTASLINTKILQQEKATESTIYLGDQYRLNNKISVQGGIRYSFYRIYGPKSSFTYKEGLPRNPANINGNQTFENGETIQTYHGPEFRVSARYLLTPRSSIKLSFNTLRQYIHMVTNTTALSPTDIWKLSDQFIKPQLGKQVSLGFYTQTGDNGDEFSLESYFKTTKNYLDYKSGAQLVLNDNLEQDILNTRGKAFGIEVLYKKPIGKLNGWISYTFLRSFLQVDDPLAGEVVNGGKYYPANYDKPHIASLVANYKFTQRFSISLTSTYSTGRPVTYPIGVFNMGGAQRVFYSERNAFRIPDFFRTDLSMILENNHKLTQKLHGSWTFGIYNVTGRDNPYSVYFVTDSRQIKGYQLSIFASAIPFVTFNLKFR